MLCVRRCWIVVGAMMREALFTAIGGSGDVQDVTQVYGIFQCPVLGKYYSRVLGKLNFRRVVEEWLYVLWIDSICQEFGGRGKTSVQTIINHHHQSASTLGLTVHHHIQQQQCKRGSFGVSTFIIFGTNYVLCFRNRTSITSCCHSPRSHARHLQSVQHQTHHSPYLSQPALLHRATSWPPSHLSDRPATS